MQPEALSLGQDHPGAEQQNECNLSVEIQAWQMENGEEKEEHRPDSSLADSACRQVHLRSKPNTQRFYSVEVQLLINALFELVANRARVRLDC
jgi:hypothetical protein